MPIIEIEDLHKSFGDVHALTGVDLSIEEGTVYGLLGPNGAGKTTAVRVLTTLLAPDRGRASVAGLDVVRDAQALRSVIGLAGQYAAVDENLTGRENLEMVGRLYRLGGSESRRRADDILEQFDLVEAGGRPVRTYSGGMRRRLDLGASLVAHPRVLFLDEPTTGLDPRSRLGLWGFIEELVEEGTTLLLTTQYLEEADRLADRIGVIDHGRLIAEGTSSSLKDEIGGDVVAVKVSSPEDLAEAVKVLTGIGTGEPQVDADEYRVQVPVDGPRRVAEVVRGLDGLGIEIHDLALRRPTLDDVFLNLTGHAAVEKLQPKKISRRQRRQQMRAS